MVEGPCHQHHKLSLWYPRNNTFFASLGIQLLLPQPTPPYYIGIPSSPLRGWPMRFPFPFLPSSLLAVHLEVPIPLFIENSNREPSTLRQLPVSN